MFIIKKAILVSLIFSLIVSTSCKNEPTHRVEIDLNECLMSLISSDERVLLEKTIKEYENHLIEQKILHSSKSFSYYNLYKKIASGNSINLKNDFKFSDKIDFLSRENNFEIMDCLKDLKKTERYLNSKVYKIEKGIEYLEERGILTTSQKIAQNVISILSPEDFELDYYKLNAILFIEKNNMNSY